MVDMVHSREKGRVRERLGGGYSREVESGRRVLLRVKKCRASKRRRRTGFSQQLSVETVVEKVD